MVKEFVPATELFAIVTKKDTLEPIVKNVSLDTFRKKIINVKNVPIEIGVSVTEFATPIPLPIKICAFAITMFKVNVATNVQTEPLTKVIATIARVEKSLAMENVKFVRQQLIARITEYVEKMALLVFVISTLQEKNALNVKRNIME